MIRLVHAGVSGYPVDPNQLEWAHRRCRTVAPLEIRVDGPRSYSSNHTNLLIYCAQIVAHCFGLTLIRNIFCENVNAKRIPVRNTFYFRCHYLPLNIFWQHPYQSVKWTVVVCLQVKVATFGPDVNLTYFTFRGRLGCLGHSLKASKQSGEYFWYENIHKI